MLHQLHVMVGPERGRVFQIVPGSKLIIGRGQQSHTKINDPHMSRVQCSVEVVDGGIRLEDAGGKNTLYRGRPITLQDLKSGEEFQCGSTLFRYTAGDLAEDRTVQIAIRPTGVPQAVGSPGAPSAASNPPPSLPSARPDLRDLIGQSFAHYRIDSLIASGTTGLVFRGTDTQKQSQVAIKVLFPDRTSSDEEKERFIRAMKTMLPIRHPNLIRLWNAGKTGPYCWAVMDYIEGESLSQLIQRVGVEGMLDWRVVWRIAMDIAAALQAAFEHQFVHRNVSPKNIMQRKADRVCLLGDLMLAKALEGTLAKQITAMGGMVGDLAYLSPERTRDEGEIDWRSDQYALGATLYALLTGRPPIQADSTLAMIQAIREATPVSPNHYQLSIHTPFADIVLKMLSKAPSDRYARPAALIQELDRIGRYQGLIEA